MIRVERDPAFWEAVASHPEVAPHVGTGKSDFTVGQLIAHPAVTPLAAEHGGFLFLKLDGLGRVFELHSLFTPEGWGREVLGAGKEALDLMFGQGMALLTTYEVEGNWRSRPPKSFGWREAAPFANKHKPWLLTRVAWDASPARRRMT